jgi:hypothetical protein
MSDRTPGSVRTGARDEDSAAPAGTPAEAAPVSATQQIPTTGSQRAQAAGSTAAGSAAAPVTSSSVPAAQPAGSAAGSATGPAAGPPTVPPVTDAGPAVPPAAAASVPGTDPVGEAQKSRGRGPAKAGGRGPRRARLQLRHIDTWSALKISLVLSIALFFIWMVAVGVLYGVLSALNVFDTLNDLFGQIGTASGGKAGEDVVTPGVVFGGAAVIGAINILLLTALCTVGTFIYNLCSDLVGGLELTLSERD